MSKSASNSTSTPCPGFFGDIAKLSKDLISKGYSFDNKLSIKSKTSNGVKLAYEGKLGNKGVASKFSAGLGLGHGLTLDKIQVESKGVLTTELSLADTGVEGLETKFTCKTASLSANAPDEATIGFEYKGEGVGITAEVDAVSLAGGASALVGYEGFRLGGRVGVASGGSAGVELTSYAAGLGYTASGATFATTLSSGSKGYNLDASIYQRVDKKTEWALSAAFPNADLAKASVTAGTAYKIDSSSSVKANINTSGLLSLNYSQKVQPCITLEASAAVDTTKLEQDVHKLGFALSFA